MPLLRKSVLSQKRTEERRILGLKSQELPRRTRREQSPEVQALPSEGAPV